MRERRKCVGSERKRQQRRGGAQLYVQQRKRRERRRHDCMMMDISLLFRSEVAARETYTRLSVDMHDAHWQRHVQERLMEEYGVGNKQHEGEASSETRAAEENMSFYEKCGPELSFSFRGRRLRDGFPLQGEFMSSSSAINPTSGMSGCTTTGQNHRGCIENSTIRTNVVVDVYCGRGGLCGGGGDGGSTGAESRSAYLEMYAEKKKDKADRGMTLFNRYTTCALSGAPLDEVAVVDEIGNIINKEELLKRMLDGSLRKIRGMGHIRSIKDVYDVTLTRRESRGKDGEKEYDDCDGEPSATVRFCCPVLGLPMNGRFNFVLLKKHKMIVSERATRNAKLAVEEMIGAKFVNDENSVLSLYPSEEIAEERRAEAMERQRQKLKEKAGKKKEKKRMRNGENGEMKESKEQQNVKRSNIAYVNDVHAASMSHPQAKGGFLEGKSDAYKSIFLSSRPQGKETETFCARSVSARGFSLK